VCPAHTSRSSLSFLRYFSAPAYENLLPCAQSENTRRGARLALVLQVLTQFLGARMPRRFRRMVTLDPCLLPQRSRHIGVHPRRKSPELHSRKKAASFPITTARWLCHTPGISCQSHSLR